MKPIYTSLPGPQGSSFLFGSNLFGKRFFRRTSHNETLGQSTATYCSSASDGYGKSALVTGERINVPEPAQNWDIKLHYQSIICCMPDTGTPCAGANTGIGYETAKALASKGYATVLACRNLNKGRAARDKIKCALLQALLRRALQNPRHSLNLHVIA